MSISFANVRDISNQRRSKSHLKYFSRSLRLYTAFFFFLSLDQEEYSTCIYYMWVYGCVYSMYVHVHVRIYAYTRCVRIYVDDFFNISDFIDYRKEADNSYYHYIQIRWALPFFFLSFLFSSFWKIWKNVGRSYRTSRRDTDISFSRSIFSFFWYIFTNLQE